jgi:hypothetical protein
LRDGNRSSSCSPAPCAAGTYPPGTYNGDYVDDFEYSPGAGDLDECNGHTHPTDDSLIWSGSPNLPGSPKQTGVYHYHITEEYPYIPHCFTYSPDCQIAEEPNPEPVPTQAPNLGRFRGNFPFKKPPKGRPPGARTKPAHPTNGAARSPTEVSPPNY